MTDAARLLEIEKRCNEATAGPWHIGVTYRCHVWSGPISASNFPVATVRNEEHDAPFIAASRSDVPWLLSKCRGLIAENERLQRENTAFDLACFRAKKIVDRFAVRDAVEDAEYTVGSSDYRDFVTALDAALAAPEAGTEGA